jgi:hypothetical protein
MGWQYGVLHRQNLRPSFIALLGTAGVRGFALALRTVRRFSIWSGNI